MTWTSGLGSSRQMGVLESGDEVQLLPGSGVYRSRLGPAEIAFGAVAPVHDLQAGSWSQIPFTLVNDGDRPARDVRIGFQADRDMAIRPRTIVFSRSPAQLTTWSGPGRVMRSLSLSTWAHTNANSPGLELSLEAGKGDATAYGAVGEAALIAAVVCVAGLILVRRRYRRPSGDESAAPRAVA